MLFLNILNGGKFCKSYACEEQFFQMSNGHFKTDYTQIWESCRHWKNPKKEVDYHWMSYGHSVAENNNGKTLSRVDSKNLGNDRK